MRDVSLRTGFSEGYVVSILQECDGQRDPSVEAIIKIAAEVGVSLAWLLDGVELTGSAAKLLRSFSELEPDQQDALQALADTMKPRAPRPMKIGMNEREGLADGAMAAEGPFALCIGCSVDSRRCHDGIGVNGPGEMASTAQ